MIELLQFAVFVLLAYIIIIVLTLLLSADTLLIFGKMKNKKFNCPKCDSLCHFVAFHNVFDFCSSYFECESCHSYFDSGQKEIIDFSQFQPILP